MNRVDHNLVNGNPIVLIYFSILILWVFIFNKLYEKGVISGLKVLFIDIIAFIILSVLYCCFS